MVKKGNGVRFSAISAASRRRVDGEHPPGDLRSSVACGGVSPFDDLLASSSSFFELLSR